jgi:hypothetical protein
MRKNLFFRIFIVLGFILLTTLLILLYPILDKKYESMNTKVDQNTAIMYEMSTYKTSIEMGNSALTED